MNKQLENKTLVSYSIIGICAISAILSLWLWINHIHSIQLEKRVPGLDKENSLAQTPRSRTGPEGQLIISRGKPAEIEGLWNRFRGPNLDNISSDTIQPVPAEQGFLELWNIEVGEGFAGPAVLNGRVYLMDYDRENKEDSLRCLSLQDGEEIWRYTYPINIKRNHGITRTTSAVNENVVVGIGPKGHVTALNSKTGQKNWSLDLVFAYDAEIPPWYAGQNPLLDDGRVILAPAGSSLLIAVDAQTGEIIWETPNPNGWKMTHSSVMPMEYQGQKTYVYCASGGVTGVSADDGCILWEFDEWIIKMANVPSPLVIDRDRLFFSGGYQAGSMMLQLQTQDGNIIPTVLFRLEDAQFGSTQHTPIYYQNHIYGVRPDGQLVCLDLDGNILWSSGRQYRFGLGSYILIDSLLYVLDDDGLLSRVQATPNSFQLIDQTQVLHGHESWGPMAYVSGRLIVRDLTQMACIEIALSQPDV